MKIFNTLLLAFVIATIPAPAHDSADTVEQSTLFNPKARVNAGEVIVGETLNKFTPISGDYLPYEVKGHLKCWIEMHKGEYVWCTDGFETYL